MAIGFLVIVYHSCGNGHEGCINPQHINWKTPTENNADKEVHGTSYRGEDHWNDKLTEDDVRQIRSLLGTMTQVDIAKLFNVHPSHISNIEREKCWGWLDR